MIDKLNELEGKEWLNRLINGEPTNTEDELFNLELLLESTVTGYDLLTDELAEPPKLWGDILPKNQIGFLVGSSDTGKSMFLINLAVAVCTGKPFLGWSTNPEHKRAIYVSSEDDKNSFGFRLKRMNKELDLSPSELAGLRLITDWDNLYSQLESIVKNGPVDLIILDAFGDIVNGIDLNSNSQVRQFLQPYSMLAQRYGCVVLFMHHTGKRTEQLPPSKNNLIGSQAIEGKARFVYELRRDKDDPKKKHLCITKGNGIPDEYKRQSYVLNFSDDFVFTGTGERVDFDELAMPKDSSSKSSKLTPLKMEDKAHRQWLKEFFTTAKEIKGTALKTLLLAKGGSDKPNRELIELWEMRGYITNVGTERNVRWILNDLDSIEPPK